MNLSSQKPVDYKLFRWEVLPGVQLCVQTCLGITATFYQLSKHEIEINGWEPEIVAMARKELGLALTFGQA